MREKSLKGCKVLYLTVPFFEYTYHIESEMRSLGAEVDTVIMYYENNTNAFLKKLNSKLFEIKQVRYLDFSFNKIIKKGRSYDYIFVQFPHRITFKHLDLLKEKYPKAVFIHYAWDPEYVYNTSRYYSYFDKNFSFEKDDILKFGLLYHPLFFTHHFDSAYLNRSNSPIKYNLAFIGKISFYKERYQWISEMISILDQYNLSYYIFLLSNRKKYYMALLKGKKYENVSFKPLNLDEISDIYKITNTVIDQRKPNQSGLTMRTFEVLGAGCNLITSNKTILDEPFYSSNNIMLSDDFVTALSADFLCSENIRSTEMINYRIDNWLLHMFK